MGKTINLAEKYSSQVQERFYHDSITQGAFSKNLDMEFTGVKTVKVYDVAVAPLNDYTRSGSNRYGTPQELTARRGIYYHMAETQKEAAGWKL